MGALLDAASAALRNANYRPGNLTRMADAETFVLRAETGGAFPWPVGTYKAALTRKEAEKRDDAILNDPVASKIVDLAEGGDWEGPLTMLFQIIHDETHATERHYLPQVPRTLSVRLEELAPLLRGKGVLVDRKKCNKGVQVSIFRTREPESTGGAFAVLG